MDHYVDPCTEQSSSTTIPYLSLRACEVEGLKLQQLLFIDIYIFIYFLEFF